MERGHRREGSDRHRREGGNRDETEDLDKKSSHHHPPPCSPLHRPGEIIEGGIGRPSPLHAREVCILLIRP